MGPLRSGSRDPSWRSRDPDDERSCGVIFDVTTHDLPKYQEYMARIRTVIEAAGGRYLVRGGPDLFAGPLCLTGPGFRSCPARLSSRLWPLAIGSELIRHWAELKVGNMKVRILTPTQCVVDRLAAFYPVPNIYDNLG